MKHFRVAECTVLVAHICNDQDFLTTETPSYDYIVSSPPCSLKGNVTDCLPEIGKPLAMLVGIVGLSESQHQFNLFGSYEFEIMYLNRRVLYFKDYTEQKPSPNPPFGSVYTYSKTLPRTIVFEEIDRQQEFPTKYTTPLLCELDRCVTESYCAVHDASPELNIGDITKADEKSVPDFNTMFDGSPCQGFSIAGRQGGIAWTRKNCGRTYSLLEVHHTERDKCPNYGLTRIEKTCSSLLIEWLRSLREKKPCFAIYEDVENIVGARFGPTFDLFVKELEDYGYNVHWQILSAKSYGIPQNRERVYCVIIRKDLDNGGFKLPEPISLKHMLTDMLETDIGEKYYLSDEKVATMIIPLCSESVKQPELEEETQQTDNINGTWLQKTHGVRLSNKDNRLDGYSDIALTLLTGGYKGWGNQQMIGVMKIG